METSELENLQITVDQAELDEDQFVSLWNVAAATMGGEPTPTRDLAGKLLGFLCKHRCGFLVASHSDIKYLDEWFERDNKLLYDWSPESETVDVLSQHVFAPFDSLKAFLISKKFDFSKTYRPRRADRLSWFSNDWHVG